jgi:hypothetical protein
MAINKEIEKILSKPMTRKEFLRQVGLLLLGVMGVNALVSRLVHPEKHLAGTGGAEGGTPWGNGKFGV